MVSCMWPVQGWVNLGNLKFGVMKKDGAVETVPNVVFKFLLMRNKGLKDQNYISMIL